MWGNQKTFIKLTKIKYSIRVALRRLLGLIVARGGSKGLPGKNLLPVAGRPLLHWTIDAGLSSKVISRLVISTDDEKIAEAASRAGCEVPFMRPPELATDTARSMDVVRHALQELPGFQHVVLLQPTSPLRAAVDIDEAYQKLLDSGASTCVSLCSADESPYHMYTLTNFGTVSPVIRNTDLSLRRQELPNTFVLNGAIYIGACAHITGGGDFLDDETVAHIMPRSRSLDIDTAEDFDRLRELVSLGRIDLPAQ